MKRVLFDQNVPRPLRRLLAEVVVSGAAEMGWSRVQNGHLLDVAEEAGFDVLLSGDKGIPYQQTMAGRKIALVCLSDNHLEIVKQYVAAINLAINEAAPGTVTKVYCGTFIPRKFRKDPGPSA